MSDWGEPYNILGFVGGVVLAGALLPQIYLAHKRGSCKDISYGWQAVYTVGLLTLMTYYAHFRLWPVFYPMAFEFSCLVYLTGLKTYYEVVLKRGNPDVDEELDASRADGAGSETSKSGRISLGLGLSEFDMSRSGRVGRVLSDASRSGRMARQLGSDSSLVGDSSIRSGKHAAAAAASSGTRNDASSAAGLGGSAVAVLFGGIAAPVDGRGRNGVNGRLGGVPEPLPEEAMEAGTGGESGSE